VPRRARVGVDVVGDQYVVAVDRDWWMETGIIAGMGQEGE
jgi:hypothetical protein